MVRHADLDDDAAARPELDQQLGREERAAGFDGDSLERLAAEELAGTVDVADAKAEPDEVREAVRLRVDRSDERIGSFDPVADDRIGRIRFGEPLGQPADVGNAELAGPPRGSGEGGARKPGG